MLLLSVMMITVSVGVIYSYVYLSRRITLECVMCYLNTVGHRLDKVTHRTVGHQALLAQDVELFTNVCFSLSSKGGLYCWVYMDFMVGNNFP